MKKAILLVLALVLCISCADKKQKDSKESKLKTEENQTSKANNVGTQNYAVVFKWATGDEQLAMHNSMPQADQLAEMWKKGIVENVYYDTDAKVDKFSYFPNITFVLNATDLENAKQICDNLIVVKEGVATYTLHPVGTLWLKRKTDVINKNGITKSYVAVWNTDYTPERTMTQAQNDVILELWNEGKIENVYFDIEGTQVDNDKTDFVFFINANSEEAAESIIEPLPFVRNAVASYKLYQVGVFWMGINE